ncbi:hypothetical protein AAFF_G00246070 [Aldrovandia affinis]|uniref:Uncharacterized protein n=1 Tax=Aldrovandia affinis TaxID=143900 RepID=A0AAD7STZ8_9TELE|nr:hypothetical protein AAFF_G00246070 [Aldrovandia affinis]
MEYRLFIRAFEYGVEDKTDSNKDQLYFMEQYTSGQPRELIQSCLHNQEDLKKRSFLKDLEANLVHIDKALNWPTLSLSGHFTRLVSASLDQRRGVETNMRFYLRPVEKLAYGILDKQIGGV